MRIRLWLVGVVCAIGVSAASAATISVTMPSELVDTTIDKKLSLDLNFVFSDLNGVVLNGQTIDLDVVFADDVLIRLATYRGFYALIDLGTTQYEPYTTAASISMIDDLGQREPSSFAQGSGFGSNNTFAAVGLFNYGDDQHWVHDLLSGFHFDVTLPDSGAAITSGRFNFGAFDEWGIAQFTTSTKLPEPSTLLLFALGCPLALRRRRP